MEAEERRAAIIASQSDARLLTCALQALANTRYKRIGGKEIGEGPALTDAHQPMSILDLIDSGIGSAIEGVGEQMASRVSQEEIEAIEKLERFVSSGDAHVLTIFTKEEIDALRRVAAREKAWQALGTLASSAKTILTYIGFFIVAWAAFKSEATAWLSNLLVK